MKAEFKNCTSSYKEEYNLALREDDIDEEEVTCKLVESIVETCGDLWSRCHTEEEVRRMKDMQVESLLIKNREASIDIERCPTAKKLGSQQPVYDEYFEDCSDEELRRS